MKKFLLMFCFLLLKTFAQDGNQGVELPQFVITGKEENAFSTASKIDPEFIPTLSKDYLMPSYTAEEVQVKEFSKPVTKSNIGLDSFYFYNGRLNVLAGFNNLPKGDLSFYYPLSDLIFFTDISGFNQRAYVGNANEFYINGNAKLKYFFTGDDNFFSGSNLLTSVNLMKNKYNFFGSPKSDLNRDLFEGNFSVNIQNLSSKNFLYDLKIQDYITKINAENLSENLLKLSGTTNIPLATFEVSGKLDFVYQSFQNKTFSKRNFSFFQADAFLGLKISKIAKINFGFEFSSFDSSFVVNPQAKLSLKLDRGVMFFAEYTPGVDFLTSKDFLEKNRYFVSDSVFNHFYKRSSTFLLAVKFEYKRTFEFYGGLKYTSSDEYPYFSDELSPGFFRFNKTEAKNISLFFNVGFHPGRFGYFYAETVVGKTSDTANFVLPYSPAITASVNYDYRFDFGLLLGSKFTFISGTYADIANSIKLDPCYDLSFHASYDFADDFSLVGEVNNLFNRDNFMLKNYKSLPLDVLFGINYRW